MYYKDGVKEKCYVSNFEFYFMLSIEHEIDYNF